MVKLESEKTAPPANKKRRELKRNKEFFLKKIIPFL